MEWQPTWFKKWSHTWDGGGHEWTVTERTARSRLTERRGLVTAWSDGGVPHTVLTLRDDGYGTLQHARLPGRDLVHRLTFRAEEGADSLAVLPPREGAPFGSHDPHVVYEDWPRPGTLMSRHTGDIRERSRTTPRRAASTRC